MHRSTRRIAFPCLLLLITTGAVAQEDRRAEAQAMLTPFKQAFRQTLMTALRDGPIAALDRCRVDAPALAGQYATDGIRLGRTSHRLRNPGNAPADWLKPVLDNYAAQPGKAAPAGWTLPDGRYAYVEPIRIQPPCLLCHGRNLAPALKQRLDTLYPDDQATGFALGDFRGLFWVLLPAPDTNTAAPPG